MVTIHLLIAAGNLYAAWLPNPPDTWFGEGLFGRKILPWPVMNGICVGMAIANVWAAYAVWQSQIG